MHSAASADSKTARDRTKKTTGTSPLSRLNRLSGLVPAALLFGGIAATVAVASRADGGYGVSHSAPLGLLLVAAAAVLYIAGARCTRAVWAPAVLLVAIGAWSAFSTVWGGLPNPAWSALNHWLIAAAALVTGAMLATSEARKRLVLAAVLAGVTIHAIELLGRLASGPAPTDWVHDWFGWVDGPVGYHNAQAALLALGLPLALWASSAPRALARIGGGVSAGFLLGALILTQSRGALVAVLVAIVVQVILVRRLRVVVLGALYVGVGLLFTRALRAVDAATVEGTASEQLAEFRTYALWTALAAAVLAAAAAARFPTTNFQLKDRTGLPRPKVVTRRRAVTGVVVATTVLLAIGASVAGRDGATWVKDSVVSDESTPPATGSATRLSNISFNGRLRQWRVAADTVADGPFLGAGQGQFARAWTVGREEGNTLYVLQPHSLELELLSEVGVVGLALFLGFVALTITALMRAKMRSPAAAAVGVLVIVLVQASVDWTWSFAALVGGALLVSGAAIGGTRTRQIAAVTARSRKLRLALPVAVVLVASSAAVSLALPYLSDRQLETAISLEESNPSKAIRAAQASHRLNPWDARTLSLLGRLAEAQGDFRVAADRYRAAAVLSQRPWLEHFREARALASVGAFDEVRHACRQAFRENPGEQELQAGACAI